MTVLQAKSSRDGFTILEVLIALTASLLLMLGLARAYKLLGDKITERQSELDLSSRLRDVAIQLRDELRRATCDMTPPASQAGAEGYLVYHEGPFADTTTIQGSIANPAPVNASEFPDSRYGDFDDYLAFTTRATEGAPFVGFIPRGILDAKRFARMSGPARAATEWGDPTDLVPFYSRVAEIAYWLSPEWERNPADGTLVYTADDDVPDANGLLPLYPRFRDRDGDLLPDRMSLHRRVLLIRPDLNMTPAEIYTANFGSTATPGTLPPHWYTPSIPFLVNNGGTRQIVALTDGSGASQAFYKSVNPTTAPVSLAVPGRWSNLSGATAPVAMNDANIAQMATASPDWMVGLARMQQVMDLSISRTTEDRGPRTSQSDFGPRDSFFGSNGPPIAYGMPTSIVRANSLSDLTRPENRFAYCRIPQALLNGFPGSTMPQLALCPPHAYITARESSPPVLPDPNDPLLTNTPTTFPTQASHVGAAAPGDTPLLGVYGRFTMTTFLRPEFNLADQVTDRNSLGSSVALVNRAGADIIATDVVGFDIKVFDPEAPRFIWHGPDQQAGNVGDDDGDGVPTNAAIGPTNPDDPDELGWPSTDDEFVGVNSLRLDQVLINNGNRTFGDWVPNAVSPFSLIDRGEFVDVGYGRLSGGPMGGLIQYDESGNGVPDSNIAFFVSEFSGIQNGTTSRAVVGATVTDYASTYPASWEQSGRFVLKNAAGHPAISSFYQPVFDTWTDSYATDPFDQEGEYLTAIANNYGMLIGGISASTAAFNDFRTAQNNPASSLAPQNRNVVAKFWSQFQSVGQQGEFSGTNAGQSSLPTTPSANPIEITPPVPQPLRAIKISIRLNDFGAETIRQQTVVQEF
ncbi:MAG: hypothetical protein AAF802_06235 [Planctomycetota bacterium]